RVMEVTYLSSEPTSEIQRRMYNFIAEYMKREGMPPTNREIGREMNIASTGHVDYHLTMLEKKGLISRQAKKSRSITLVKPLSGIPVKGKIAAGEPLDIFPVPSEEIGIGKDLEQQDGYALVATDQSMIQGNIGSKDYVIIKPQNSCE